MHNNVLSAQKAETQCTCTQISADDFMFLSVSYWFPLVKNNVKTYKLFK